MNSRQQTIRWSCPDWHARLAVTGLLLLPVIILFRDLLTNALRAWSNEPQYSYGFLILPVGVFLGWSRREHIRRGTARTSLFGLSLFLFGIGCQLMALWIQVNPIQVPAFLVTLAGMLMLVWGQKLFLGTWPAVLFFGLMFPLPPALERMYSTPLQAMGTSEVAWYLQLLGIPAIAQENLILTDTERIDVAEAFSGLRMLMVALAVSAAVSIASRRTPWERLLILCSAFPAAFILTMARVILRVVVARRFGENAADLLFFDLSAWLLTPLAFLLLYLMLRIFDLVLIESKSERPTVGWYRIQERNSAVHENRPAGDLQHGACSPAGALKP